MRQRDCLGVDFACVVLVRFAVVFLMGAKHLEASLWTDNTLWASSFFFFFFVYKNLCSGTTCVVWIWVPILLAATLSTKHFYNCFVLSMFSPSSLSEYFLFFFCWIPCYLTHQAGPPIYFFSNICIHALNIKSLVPHVAVLVQGYPGHAMAFTLPLV